MKDVTPPPYPTAIGEYVGVDDMNVDDFADTPEPILFTVSGDSGSASTNGLAQADACHCHADVTTDIYYLTLE